MSILSKTHCVHVYTTGRKCKVRTKLIINLSVVIGDGTRRVKTTQKGERIVLNGGDCAFLVRRLIAQHSFSKQPGPRTV